MGSVSLKIGDGTARFHRATLCSSSLNLIMLASVLATNLFALYAFTSRPLPPPHHLHNKTLSAISDHVSLILREIESSDQKLHQIERDLAGHNPPAPPELRLFLARHPLPLGRDARSGITDLVASVANSCSRSSAVDLLSRYMSYKPNSPCPTDDLHLPVVLLSKGCDPLPRRRCLTRNPKPAAFLPFPSSLWPPAAPGLDRETWVKARGKNDFLVDEILALGGTRGIRIGLDIGSGAGNFAARMAERNVTIVTSTVDTGDLIAARGLIPLLLTPAQRFPFYDSVFDLIHTTRGLDDGGFRVEGRARPEALEFIMFDIDRVLRTGGLFWLDNYLCIDNERKRTVTKLIERFGYKKLKWVVGEKAGEGKPQVYLSAVLQKPARG